ncbi:hypothetical protein [Candidatus Neomicrothrix sp.]|uniref:hypothetical protein n=1 Tax=Candidatus Neomicrothrix sp. TaxID=2719034 RepID=UPI0030B973F6
MDINICKRKKRTNMRASGRQHREDATHANGPRPCAGIHRHRRVCRGDLESIFDCARWSWTRPSEPGRPRRPRRTPSCRAEV